MVNIKKMIDTINRIFDLTKNSSPEKRIKSLESFTKSLGYVYKSNDTTISIKENSDPSFFSIPINRTQYVDGRGKKMTKQ
jgi:hypothetical protein